MKILLVGPLNAKTLDQPADAVAQAQGLCYTLGQAGVHHDVRLVIHEDLSQVDLVKDFSGRRHLFGGSYYRPRALQHDVKRRLGAWRPDLLLAINGPRSLRHLYPNTLALHVDSAFLSRAPFGHNIVCDPFGIQSRCFPNLFAREIKALSLTSIEENILIQFKESLRHKVEQMSPLKRVLEPWRAKYPHIVMLALDGLAPWIKKETGCRSSSEFFVRAMRQIPRHIGVVVTQHPGHKALDASNLEKKLAQYPNLIYLPELDRYHSPSLFLISQVDAIVTISSAVRIQANLLWDKPIIGDTRYNINAQFSNAYSLQDISLALKAIYIKNLKTLYWYLTRYLININFFLDANYLDRYLKEFVDSYRQGGLHFCVHPVVDSLQAQTERLLHQLDSGVILKPTEKL